MKNYRIEKPADIAQIVSDIECHEQSSQSVRSYVKTSTYDRGNSVSIAVLASYYLEVLGFEPMMMNFIVSDKTGIMDVKIMSSPIYKNGTGKYHAVGIATPKGVVKEDIGQDTLEDMAVHLSKKLEEMNGIKTKYATITNLDEHSKVIDWRGEDDCSYLMYALPNSKKIFSNND